MNAVQGYAKSLQNSVSLFLVRQELDGSMQRKEQIGVPSWPQPSYLSVW